MKLISYVQVGSVVGGPLSLKNIQLSLLSTWQRVKEHCVEACTRWALGNVPG